MALKTCVTNYSFAKSLRGGQMNVEQFCDFCGKAGFEGVELISYFWKDKDAEMKALPAWLKRNKLTLAGYGTRSNFLTRKPEEIEQSNESIRVAIEDSKRIGATTCRVFGGSRFEGWTQDEALAQMIASFKKLTPAAEKAGVCLTIENHGGYPATADEVIAVIEGVNSPCFASLLDTGNFLTVKGEDPLAAAKKLAPYVRHVHVKDMLRLPAGFGKGHKPARADYEIQPCLIGKGAVPNKDIFAALKAAGYDGYLSIEAEGPDTDDEIERVMFGLANIRKWLTAP